MNGSVSDPINMAMVMISRGVGTNMKNIEGRKCHCHSAWAVFLVAFVLYSYFLCEIMSNYGISAVILTNVLSNLNVTMWRSALISS